MTTDDTQAELRVASYSSILPGSIGEIPIEVCISQFEQGDNEHLSIVAAKTTTTLCGIIDTGASNTCLSYRLIERLKLQTIGKCKVGTANGDGEHCLHIINFFFKSQTIFAGLKVTSGDIGDPDFLLGMDILRQAHLTIFPVHDQLFVDFKIFMPIVIPNGSPAPETSPRI